MLIKVGDPGAASQAVQHYLLGLPDTKRRQALCDFITTGTIALPRPATAPLSFVPPAVVFVESRVGADLLAKAIGTVTGGVPLL